MVCAVPAVKEGAKVIMTSHTRKPGQKEEAREMNKIRGGMYGAPKVEKEPAIRSVRL